VTSSVKPPRLPAMANIETLTKKFADAKAELRAVVIEVRDERDQILKKGMPRIRRLAAAAKEREAELKAAIEESPELFEKPRTQIFHGVKVGYRKATGKIEFEDADQVVKLIRKHFAERFDELVKTEEKPIKEALERLSAAELKKLGIEVADTGDVVFVKDVASEVDKIVKALLKDAPEEIEA
jgi:arsenate reductase-like glutaredoxin family protein